MVAFLEGPELIFVVLYVGIWVGVFGGIGYRIGDSRGRASAGCWLGTFLGPLGLVITALLERTPEAEAAYLQRVAAASGTHPISPPPAPPLRPAKTTGPPLGWYKHPENGVAAWWDGARWFEQAESPPMDVPATEPASPVSPIRGETKRHF